MNDVSPLDLAALGYHAFGNFADWTNDAGNTLPSWAELPEPQRRAWESATNAVRDRVLAGRRCGCRPRSAYEASHPSPGGRAAATASGCCKGALCDGPGQGPQHVEVGDPRAGEPGGRA